MTMKIYFTLFFLFITGISFSQEIKEDTTFYDRSWHETDNKTTAGYYRIKQQEDTLFHFWDYYTEIDQIQNEGYYHEDDDSRYGLYTWYHRSGTKSSEGNYLHNNRTGKWGNWYKNGNLKSAGLYIENNRIDKWTWFHQDGSKQSVATYIENELTGKRTWWNKSGKVKQIGFFEKGLKTKNWETYYSDGTISSKKNYDKGQFQGPQTTYYKNGTLRNKVLYESGILKTEEWFDEEGNSVEKNEITSLKDNYALFWKISGNGLKKPSFLLGTMHIKDKNAFEYSDSLHAAFDACEGYSMEILPDKFFEHNHNKLNSHSYTFELGTELYYKEANSEFYSGRPTHQEDWIQNVGELFHRDYFDPDGMPYFMDAYLYVKAGREGKYVEGLETVEDHLGTGSKLPTYQKNFDILSEFSPDKEMVNTYLEGDIDKIEAFMNFISTEEFNYWLLTVRNHKMANTIDSLIQLRPTFNTAGAAHLPGEEGLIQLLEEKGYTVSKVISPFSKPGKVDLLEQSKRKWQSIDHENYTIQTPSLIGVILDKKQKWNICMDYLTEVAYAYTLIEGKNVDGASLIPTESTKVTPIKKSQYGREVMEWTYDYNEHHYTLLQLKKEKKSIFIRVTSLHSKPTLPTYNQDILKIVNSVKLLDNAEAIEEQIWQKYDSEYFSIEAPGQPTLDTTVYSLYYYSGNQTSVVRFLFHDGEDQYIVREASELNSRRYDGFSSLADFTTNIYDSIFQNKPSLTEIDTVKKRLYIEYQQGDVYNIVQMFRKGYTTYTSISTCNKLNLERARKYHASFQLKKLIALEFKTYTAPFDSFTVNLPSVEIDFETPKRIYSNFNSSTKFNLGSEILNLVTHPYTRSDKNVYKFTYSAFDTLSKIKYEIISKKFRPYYHLKDSSAIMSDLFYIDMEKDSVSNETSTSLDFYKKKGLGVRTRYKSIRNNRNALTLKCTFPSDLEEYVDTIFFNTLTTNWKTDSININEDKKEAIKEALEKESLAAAEALIYNSWTIKDLTFLLSLKPMALENDNLASKLIRVFNDSLQNDSSSLLIYELAKNFDEIKEDAFWKLLGLRNSTSVWALDTLSKNDLPIDLDDLYEYNFSGLADSIEYGVQIISVLHKNTTNENQLDLLNMEVLSYMDSSAYLYIPLQDSIISWTWDLLREDTLREQSNLLDSYLQYLIECPATEGTYELFLECTSYENIEIQATAMLYLLSNGKNTKTDLIEKLLENRFYRLRILKALNDNGLLNTVPDVYLTKQAIAEDQVYATNESYNLGVNSIKVRFLEVKKAKVDGATKLVHLFRLEVNSAKYVVMVGYQPKSKGITFENELYKEMSFERAKDIPKIQEAIFKRIGESEQEHVSEEVLFKF